MAIQIKDFKEIDPNFTVVDLLHQRSLTQPDTIAFTFLEDGETQESTLTYQQLVKRSCAIASQLQALNLNGERALLLYPPGLDYLTAFLVVYTLELLQFRLIHLSINAKHPE